MHKLLFLVGKGKSFEYLEMLSTKKDLFEVISVDSMEKAIATLDNERISILLFDHLDNLDIDGLELLAYVTRNHPMLPCIVMTSYGKPWFRDFEKKRAVYILNKPIEEGSLITAVLVALEMRDKHMVSDCMTVKSILPLIEMEQRTCGLTVERRNREKGYLYFDKGELIGAFCKNNNGESAAHEIAGWKKIKIVIAELRRRKRYRHFNIDLMELAGAEWFHDIQKVAHASVTASDTAGRFSDAVEKELQYCFFGNEPENRENQLWDGEMDGIFTNPENARQLEGAISK